MTQDRMEHEHNHAHNGLKVLLVEDEPAVRLGGVQALQLRGIDTYQEFITRHRLAMDKGG